MNPILFINNTYDRLVVYGYIMYRD